MKKLTIDRSKWLCGENCFKSSLLRSSDGKKDCFGFLGLSRGLSESDMSDVASLAGIPKAALLVPEFVALSTGDIVINSDPARLIMRINDAPLGRSVSGIVIDSEVVREQLLISEFDKHGIALTFVD